MYKCEWAMFKEPYKYYEDTGELWQFVRLAETSFDKVINVNYAVSGSSNSMVTKSYNCAEEAYETRLGLKFIENHKEDF